MHIPYKLIRKYYVMYGYTFKFLINFINFYKLIKIIKGKGILFKNLKRLSKLKNAERRKIMTCDRSNIVINDLSEIK